MTECIHQRAHREAVKVIRKLASNRRVLLYKAAFLISEYMPSLVVETRERLGQHVRLITKGAREKLNHISFDLAMLTEVNLQELCVMEILTPEGANAIRTKNYDMFRYGEWLKKNDSLP